MKKLILNFLLLAFSLQPLFVAAAEQEPLFMVRSPKPFEAALEQLSAAITFNEYKVSRIQRVDVGLTKTGYKTEKYRVVFFGKTSEINSLAEQAPELIPFIPLKIVIFAEGGETIILAMNPHQLRKLVPNKKLFPVFRRWEQDLRQILESAKE